jgi:hypothetical protein
MSKKEPIYHLLKPKEYRTWCIPSRVPSGGMNLTNLPSKCSCVNCLTALRYEKQRDVPQNKRPKGSGVFRKKWTSRTITRPDVEELRYAK